MEDLHLDERIMQILSVANILLAEDGARDRTSKGTTQHLLGFYVVSPVPLGSYRYVTGFIIVWVSSTGWISILLGFTGFNLVLFY